MTQDRPYRVLILCTGNSARSQIGEALLAKRGGGRVRVASAGARPASRVNPFAIEVLREAGVEWSDRSPRGLDGLEAEPWDLVLTVCDRAREACPLFPGSPVQAHWGMPDPAEAEGTDEQKRQAFRQTMVDLSRRIDRLLSLPLEERDPKLGPQIQEIGES